MFNYIFDTTSQYNTVLIFVIFFLVVVLLSMIYFSGKDKNKLTTKIEKLNSDISNCKEAELKASEIEIPEFPEIKIPECPDCKCPENKECPTCPTTSCPSLEDIISGVFPGRNTGVTSSGRYFDVQANEEYELSPGYDFYKPSQAFPDDSILSAPDNILEGNPNIPSNQIGNTYENYLLLNQNDAVIDTRMLMGLGGVGINTGPTTFGQGTSVTRELTPLESKAAETEEAARKLLESQNP